MKENTKRYLGFALLPVACIVAALGAELFLRLIAPDAYYVWPPNISMTFAPSAEAMPGIIGESHFTINRDGLRGRPISDEDGYRILAIGGSTTECLYLDDSEAWPHLLEEKLAVDFSPGPVWVGNAGKSGHTVEHHVLQARSLLAQYPHVDLALVLVGTNDMMNVGQESGYNPLEQSELEQAFAIRPGGWQELDAGYPWYKRTELWRTLRKARENLLADRGEQLVQDEAGAVYVELRRKRQSASGYVDAFPDLGDPLRAYKSNLNAIVDAAELNGTELVLMTQPSLWSGDLPNDAARLLWMGRKARYMTEGPQAYYSAATLAKAMAAYNTALLEVCADRSLRCLDLAVEIPKESTYFYDDVHFTEAGARLVADVVERHVRSLRTTGRRN
jgi:lysophospholipase L1-like esterase